MFRWVICTFVWVLISQKVQNCDNVVIEALHNYMSEPELVYYFNSPSKIDIPEYEVVYLPLISSDDTEQLKNFDFSAFQR